MLGGAILLIVVVLFFGIRAFMGSGKGDSSKDTTDEQVTADNDQGNVPSSPANDGETDGKKDANPMEKANEEITSLIKSYYTALGDKDITTLRTLVDNLAPAEILPLSWGSGRTLCPVNSIAPASCAFT